MPRGFLVHSDVAARHGQLVALLHGRLEDGRAFAVRDRRVRPYFFAEPGARSTTSGRPAWSVEPDEHRALGGAAVVRIETRDPRQHRAARDAIEAAGHATYEADLPLALRYRIDRGLRAGIDITGPESAAPRHGAPLVVFDEPELAPAPLPGSLSLRVLSIDIETSPDARHELYSVALYRNEGELECLVVAGERQRPIPGARLYRDAAALLSALERRIMELDPDVILGWNVIDFDMRVLDRLSRRHRVPLRWGRDGSVVRVQARRGGWGRYAASVRGRIIADAVQMMRGSFIKMDRWTLDHVAAEVVGASKRIAGGDRGAEIERRYREDLPALVDYNLHDARLAHQVVERLGLIELSAQRSALTGLELDEVYRSIAAFDFVYLQELRGRGRVAPTRGSSTEGARSLGGHVLEPRVGLHDHVAVLDFRSLYPSIIRTFQIDPLGFAEPGDDPIVAPGGARFSREQGILPDILARLFPERAAAIRRGDRVASQAIKILMNSFYGVLGASGCRFHHPALASAITAFGRELLLWTAGRAQRLGFEVLYGDTDSLFLHRGGEAIDADATAERLSGELAEHIRERWRVESHLELQHDVTYDRLFLPALRGSAGGARKRYVGGTRRANGRVELRFVGMEVVRRDWTQLAKTVQREVVQRLFEDRAVDGYLAEVVARLRRGDLDDQLVYRKDVRKPLESYGAAAPPHVVAARRRSPGAESGGEGRLVEYLITDAGPEPLGNVCHPIDREHYVSRQIRPAAQAVLDYLGLDFARVIGDDTQLTLF